MMEVKQVYDAATLIEWMSDHKRHGGPWGGNMGIDPEKPVIVMSAKNHQHEVMGTVAAFYKRAYMCLERILDTSMDHRGKLDALLAVQPMTRRKQDLDTKAIGHLQRHWGEIVNTVIKAR